MGGYRPDHHYEWKAKPSAAHPGLPGSFVTLTRTAPDGTPRRAGVYCPSVADLTFAVGLLLATVEPTL